MRLTEEHPDVIAAKLAAEAAARTLHDSESTLAEAEAQRGQVTPVHEASTEAPAGNADARKRLAIIDGQIAARQRQDTHGSAAETSPLSEPPNQLVILETEWQRLVRAMAEAKGHQEELRQHAERANLQASAAQANSHAQMEIIDPAFRPQRPVRGGRTNTALAGIALALVLGLLYAVGRVVLSDAIIDAGDLERLGLMPVLGVLPKLSGPKKLAEV
jgi:hypothetical protein